MSNRPLPRLIFTAFAVIGIVLAGCDDDNGVTGPNRSHDIVEAPTDLAAASESPNSIRITWADNSNNEIRFEIQRSADGPETGFELIANTAPNVTEYLDSGLWSGTTYWYRVLAGGPPDTALSAFSNVASTTTQTSLVSLRIVNASKNYLVSIRLDGTEVIGHQDLFPIDASREYSFEASGLVNYNVLIGHWEHGRPVPWFSSSGTVVVTEGDATHLRITGPTVTQLLTNFCDAHEWAGLCRDSDGKVHRVTLKVFSNGRWWLYSDDILVEDGDVELKVWNDYGVQVTFTLNPKWEETAEMPFPFFHFVTKIPDLSPWAIRFDRQQ